MASQGEHDEFPMSTVITDLRADLCAFQQIIEESRWAIRRADLLIDELRSRYAEDPPSPLSGFYHAL
jgi:hypothetical protein